MATRQVVYVAEYQGQQGCAYALNTVQYRFRPAVVGGEHGWITAARGVNLWASTGRTVLIEDPTAPTSQEQLARMRARRMRG